MIKLDKALLKINIEKAAEYDFSNHKVFGSACWVFQKDEVVYCSCFGNTSVDTKIPVKQNTLFRLASMTKPITAFAVLVLVDRGLLSLSDPVSKYIPEFTDIHVKAPDHSNILVDFGKAEKEVTVCHLLTHTLGIDGELLKSQQMTDEDKKTVNNTIKFYINAGLDFEPGTKQQYSGIGAFNVLVKIIENISGVDFHSFLKKEIFKPCGMVDTTFTPTPEQSKRMIDMHNKVDGRNAIGDTVDHCIFLDYPCTHYLGGAGLVSTVNDYAEFAKLLLNKGKAKSKQLVSADTFQLLHTPYVSKEIMPGKENWGLGVRVIVDESYEDLPLDTFGWSGAFSSHFWVDLQNQVAAVFMKNSLFDGGAANQSAQNFEKAVNASFVRE